jgi:DNA-directed RNA polymerase subunit RPC12/RpoP
MRRRHRMVTSDERREVAARLRETKAECDERGYPWMVEDLLQALEFETYEDGEDGIFDLLADLIDPTCRNTLAQNWGTFECSECGAQFEVSSVFMTESGNDDSEPIIPNYCPNCGARVVDEDD